MSWESYFLGLIGSPDSQSNVRVCDLWASSEGVLDRNNPFACSGKYPGATVCIAQCGTPSEVWAYDTIEHGCEAAANFLNGSYYAGVLTAFRTDAGEAAIWKAINDSPWCSGCQDGKYPLDLYNWVQANPTPDPQPVPEDEMKFTVFAAKLPDGRVAQFLSNWQSFHWIDVPGTLTDLSAGIAATYGTPPSTWDNGNPVANPRAFGTPENKETADLLGLPFP